MIRKNIFFMGIRMFLYFKNCTSSTLYGGSDGLKCWKGVYKIDLKDSTDIRFLNVFYVRHFVCYLVSPTAVSWQPNEDKGHGGEFGDVRPMGLPHVCLMHMNYSSLYVDTCTPKVCIQSVWAVETGMSPALDMKPVEYQWREQTRRTRGHTCILSRSMLPLSSSSGFRHREDFRLPSLPTSTHGRNTTVPLR